MIHKATRRTADVDPSLDLEELGLDWVNEGMRMGEYTAILPAIPGYTEPDDPYNYAAVFPVDSTHPSLGWEFNIRASNANAEINLYSADFGLPLSENAGDAMATVGDIPLDALIEAFETPTSVFAARRGKHASKRAAHMDLDWIQDGDQLYAELPPIPGYSTPDNPAIACIYRDLAGYWMLDIVIGDGDFVLDEAVFGDHASYSVQEWKDYVASLTPEEIAALFDEWTEESVVASRHARHARYAVKRNASISMSSWVKTDAGYFNLLPPIPGYQNKPLPAGQANKVYVAHVSDAKEWVFDMSLPLANGTEAYLDSYDFGFDSPFETAEDAELAVEHLDIQDIADVLMANGYMPDED